MTPKMLINVVLPRIIRGGEPTELTKYLSTSDAGREVLKACVRFYSANIDKPDYSKFNINTSINIEDYRYETRK